MLEDKSERIIFYILLTCSVIFLGATSLHTKSRHFSIWPSAHFQGRAQVFEKGFTK